MNQEIQQNTTDTTENKKPRMYVSFIITLLYLLTLTVFAYVSIFVYKIQNNQGVADVSSWLSEAHDEWSGFMVPLWLFAVGEILILIASFIRRPIGYVNTGFVNLVACTPFVIITVFILWTWFITGESGLSSGAFLHTISPGFLFAVLVILVNYKFQKSKAELETTKL